jgi:hypothetical protein
MTTVQIRVACIRLIALCAAYTPIAALHAQSASAPSAPNTCGVLTWSQADQKHSTLPCAPTAQKGADGKETCGISTWSLSEQRHTVLPCSSATNGEACTMLTWSQADQRHVAIPCEASAKGGGLPAPVHYGE